jgi:hypothetical protein
MAITQRPVRTGSTTPIAGDGAAVVLIPATPLHARARRGVQIYADAGNPGTVYVGLSDVTATVIGAATDGFPILAGKSVVVPIKRVGDLFCRAGGSGTNKVSWMII